MLGNEQLRQAKEDIATRDAEIDELKQRVADLEKLQTQQQSLIAMKDNDLAAAQQRLAQAPAARDGGTPWYWLGLPVLLLAALGAWLVRRRKPSPLPSLSREGSDAAGLAAAVPAGAGLDVLAEQEPWQPSGEPRREPSMPAWADADADVAHAGEHADSQVEADIVHDWTPDAGLEPAVPPARDAFTAPVCEDDGDEVLPPAVTDAPRWEEPSADAAAVAPATEALPDVPAYALQAEQQPGYRGVFDLPADVPGAAQVPMDAPAEALPSDAPDVADAAAAPLARAGQERLELAIAYLDLGDAETARILLLEVADGGDAHCQSQARELLARLS